MKTNKTKKILIVVGTRPNFIKVTQFRKIIQEYTHLDMKIVHTGQHYDQTMSTIFFEQFGVFPDYFLDTSRRSPVNQMTSIMSALEALIEETYQPDLMIVPGDVNSTLAAGLVANKLSIPLAHLESGLRSFDRKMPEETNRILVDNLSDFLFVTEPSGLKNLRAENIKGKSYYVGNTMIDTLVAYENEIKHSNVLTDYEIQAPYILITIHRPSNVDHPKDLEKVVHLIKQLAEQHKIVFPVHPRTEKKLEIHGYLQILKTTANIHILQPLGYFEFQHLIKESSLIITDSGGIQEESTYQQVPCLTLRKNTERPITIDKGTNELIPFENSAILSKVEELMKSTYPASSIPDLWDGRATERIGKIIAEEILEDEN